MSEEMPHYDYFCIPIDDKSATVCLTGFTSSEDAGETAYRVNGYVENTKEHGWVVFFFAEYGQDYRELTESIMPLHFRDRR